MPGIMVSVPYSYLPNTFAKGWLKRGVYGQMAKYFYTNNRMDKIWQI